LLANRSLTLQVSFGSIARILAAQPPYRVPWSALQLKVAHMELPDSDYLQSFNGAVVGLCVPTAPGDDAAAGAVVAAVPAATVAASEPAAAAVVVAAASSGKEAKQDAVAAESNATSAVSSAFGLRVPATVPPCTCVGLGRLALTFCVCQMVALIAWSFDRHRALD
jgi:hypothetical protein